MDLDTLFRAFNTPKKERNYNLPMKVDDKEQAKFNKIIWELGVDKWDDETLIKVLGRKWKTNLETLGVLVNIYKYVTHRSKILKLAISNTTSLAAQAFKYQRATSRALLLAQKIGLLVCVDSGYRFGEEERAKLYIWNKEAQDLVLASIKKHHILVPNHNFYNSERNTVKVSKKELDLLIKSDYTIKFSSKLRIPVTIKQKQITDQHIKTYLYLQYPHLEDYQKRMDEINKTLPTSEQIIFSPTIHLSSQKRYITKIGIRATSFVCTLKSAREANDFEETAYRDIYLQSIFHTKPFHYDVHSSIAKVTYLLNYGEWLTKDLYPQLACIDSFRSEESRSGYKKLFMYLYFDRKSQIYNHNKDLFPNQDPKEVENYLTFLHSNVRTVIGPTYDSEIFFHESCIYFDVYETLIKSGARVVQVYDSFWWTGGKYTEKNIEDLISHCAVNYYNSWKNLNASQQYSREKQKKQRDR